MICSAILVASADRSLHPLGDLAPPHQHVPSLALMPVLDRPLIAHAIADLVDFGIERVVIVTDEGGGPGIAGAIADESFGTASVRLIRRDPGLGLPAAIDVARRTIGDGPFVLRFADCLGRAPMHEQIEERDVGDHDAIVLTSRFSEPASLPRSPEALQPPAVRSPFHVGVFALGARFPSQAELVERGQASWMDDALDALERSGGRVERRLVSGWWRHRPAEGILAANGFILAGIAEEPIACEARDSDIEGAVRCHPSATIEGSVVRGPVAIAADAEIRDAFIGPFTVIGRDACVSNAEIENSVILEGSTVTDIGDRLDSSVIGPRATITRDFRIPRGTRLDVGPGATVSF